MVKKFKELVLTEDTTFTESIEVETSITCKNNMRYSLNVSGDINARNIIAGDIIAGDILCEKRIKKLKTCKTISRVFIQNKSSLVRKEQMGF